MELASKLQVRDGGAVLVVNAPDDVELTGLDRRAGVADTTAFLGFVRTSSDLEQVESVLDAARADRLAWVAYPKGGQLGTDLNRDVLAAALATEGLRPVRAVSIDDVWSGLRIRPPR